MDPTDIETDHCFPKPHPTGAENETNGIEITAIILRLLINPTECFKTSSPRMMRTNL